ncbi:MAG: restriction endonuclease [Gemmatimonadales bacterium]
MAIPDFQSIMVPLLHDLRSGERTGQETLAALASHFALTPEEIAERIPSGRAPRFANRIGWAKTHLKAAGVIEAPRRAVYRLTERGRAVLADGVESITLAFLDQFPEHVAFRTRSQHPVRQGASNAAVGPDLSSERTPEDLIDEGYQQIRTALALELRERIATMAPAAFEQLVVDVLIAMGYGGERENAGIVIGRSGDEGIDGVIQEDQLGLESIYVQAKRWQGTVGRPEIQRFAGALQGQRARKGVFITSSAFSAEALAFPTTLQTTIVLIDGAHLAQLMIDHDVGVSAGKRLEIKRLDSDYFTVE